MAVPPLCRSQDDTLDHDQNRRLIQHLEAGGISLLLYGGNANFYHLPLSEFESTLQFLHSAVKPSTLVIPSVGPAYGMMMDQARLIPAGAFPTVMILPQQGITTSAGVATGIRRFVERTGIPALVYIKHDGYIEPADVGALDRDGLISGIKYATVRPITAKDDYLTQLIHCVDPHKIISGIGEQPAVVHLRDFGLGGFTSGCVCIAPRLSQAMLSAMTRADWTEADRIRLLFKPLEDLRNAINPIRVLHEAVDAAGIAKTGPLLPLLSCVHPKDKPDIAAAAKTLFQLPPE